MKADIRNKNMVINGLPEVNNEDCRISVVNFLKNIDPNTKLEQIVTAYRIGQPGKGKNSKFKRPIMVKFKDLEVKRGLMAKKNELRNEKDHQHVYCNDDLPENARLARQRVREIGKFAKNHGYDRVQVKGDKLILDDKVYKFTDLHLLPRDLHLDNIKTRPIGKGIGYESEFSYLSNLAPSTFIMNGVRFRSAEQAFQYQKCMYCEREDTGLLIKQCTDTKMIKSMGDRTTSKQIWKNMDVMRCVLLCKFNQNKSLKKKLIDTGTSTLLCCDLGRHWCTGWRLDSASWVNSSVYPGQNHLGKMLADIRSGYSKTKNELPENTQMSQSTPMEVSKKEEKEENAIQDDSKIDVEPKLYDMIKEVVNVSGDTQKKDTTTDSGQLNQSGQVPPPTPAVNAPLETKGIEELKDENIDPALRHVSSHDSVSYDSSLYIGENTSFTRQSVTKMDGSIDLEKVLGWALPVVNTSKHLTLRAVNGQQKWETRSIGQP